MCEFLWLLTVICLFSQPRTKRGRRPARKPNASPSQNIKRESTRSSSVVLERESFYIHLAKDFVEFHSLVVEVEGIAKLLTSEALLSM